MISDSHSNGFREYDYYTADRLTSIDEDTFYANRIKLLKEWLYDETDTAYYKYSEHEKQYIIEVYENLETPFYFDYYEGWHQLLENSGYIAALGVLVLGFLMAGIFSNEFRWKADSVYFSSLYGRDKATTAKIKAGFLLVTVMYWTAMLVYSLFTLCYLGFEGANCVIQWKLWKTIYNLNMWQAWVLTLICGYISNLFLAFLTMWISARTKSTVFAVTVPFVITFVPSFLEGMADWLDKILNLMPVNLLEFYLNLRTFDVVTLERVFADAKERHGMRYTRYTGLAQVTNWVKLKFAAMNLKNLANSRWKDTHSGYISFVISFIFPRYVMNPCLA